MAFNYRICQKVYEILGMNARIKVRKNKRFTKRINCFA